MIGIGTGLWPVALQSMQSGAPPVPPQGVTYGRSMNVLFGAPSTGPVFGTEYGPNVGNADVGANMNKRWRPHPWTKFVNNLDGTGTSIAITATITSSSGGSGSRAVDDGSDSFDIMHDGGTGLRNTNGQFYSIGTVPFAKYDVFLLMEHRNDSPAGPMTCSLRDGESNRKWYIKGNNQPRWTGPWVYSGEDARLRDWPSSDGNVLVFPGCTAGTWTLTVGNAAGSPGYFYPVGVQIIERTDNLTGNGNEPTYLANQLFFEGDSYMDDEELAQRIQRRLLLDENLFRDSYIDNGVGGTSWTNIRDRILAYTFTNEMMVLWDGDDNSTGGVTDTLNKLAEIVAHKGDDLWLYIPSIPNPNDNSASKVSRYEGYRDGAITTYGAAHVFDPVPTLAALDPDRSIGGILPASIFVDAFHLTSAAKEAVAVAVAPKIASLL